MKKLFLLLPIIFLSACTTKEQAQNFCKNKGMVMSYYSEIPTNVENTNCISKYEYCGIIVRNTFSDLSDTWGNNTNNTDSISKTMSTEMDKCISNLNNP